MPGELCIPLTMKIMAAGHPLYEAERLSAIVFFLLVLLLTLSGYRIVLPVDGTGPDELPHSSGMPRECSGVVLNMCGIFPAGTGTAGAHTRALLHR
jgi:hypothetical protein